MGLVGGQRSLCEVRLSVPILMERCKRMLLEESYLKKLRPPLRLIAPMTYWITWGFVAVNFLIGVSFMTIYKPATPIIIVTTYSPIEVWGVLFTLMGGNIVYGLLANNWNWARKSHIGGLVIKAAWLLALLERIPENPPAAFVACIWGFLAFIQAVVYIYFLPANVPKDS